MKSGAMAASAVSGNEDVARYYTTKHSWRGKYKRVFCVGTKAITTLNPTTHEITNQWAYNEFAGIAPSSKANNEFIISMKKGKKTNTMTFSTDHRMDLLTEALKFSPIFCENKISKYERKFEAEKYHWTETKKRVQLVVRQHCISQVDYYEGRTLADYCYKDIQSLAMVSDYSGGLIIIHGGFGRMHLFLTPQRDQLIVAMKTACLENVGFDLRIKKEPINLQQFQNHRLGRFSDDDSILSLAEFPVTKHSRRHSEPVPRILGLSECCIVERDPSTYAIPTLRPLSEVFSLIRYPSDPQLFAIEYLHGQVRRYACTERDALLCTILDGVRASGNRDVCVKMSRTRRGYRLGPFSVAVEEEVESQYLRYLTTQPQGVLFSEAVERFNANIAYSGLNHAVSAEGLFAENKEKLITTTLTALLQREGDQELINNEMLEAQFHALRRLVASKAGFEAFTSLPSFRETLGLKVVKALKRKDDAISHAAVDTLCALMQPMHDNFDLKLEQLNKSSLLSNKKFIEGLLDILQSHVKLGSGALVVNALLDFFTFALCPPYSETTDSSLFDKILELVAGLGRYLFKLFQHPSLAIIKAAGLIMKSIIEEGEPETAAHMQELALAEGALPRHLHTALFTASGDNRLLAHRQLSRHLVGLWVTGNPTANALLRRMVPLGLVQYLDSLETVPEDEVDRMHVRDNIKAVQTISRKRANVIESTLLHWRARLRSKPQKHQAPVTLRKPRQRVKSEANWQLFYYKFMEDHSKAALIWNYKTREELREALENEIRSFTVDKEISGNVDISWNHVEFEVRYESLQEEIKIGDYYLRLLLEEGGATTRFDKPLDFFNDLYHRFLLSPKANMKAMCLQAMAIVYGHCHEQIGPFNDTQFMVRLLNRCHDRQERDRLIMFIDKLLYNKRNVKEFLDASGIKILVDFLAMSHVHTTRATVPLQLNVIEASPDMQKGDSSEKEWYYTHPKDKEKMGPFSFQEMKDLWKEGTINQKTKCWAQGMEGWRTVEDIAQLKWSLYAEGVPIMNESEIAVLVLNMLIRMCDFYPSRDNDGAVVRPLPRVKKMLSEPAILPHVVQILLTFDPRLVEKVVTLLNSVMQDNPVLPRLFMTGVFFFIMMYTGSNVLPIAKFLKYTHTKQSFRPDEQQQASDLVQRSILGNLLPEAMICFLENYGADKFSEIFLGEFDTPEAIWSNEMRRMMIEKIAGHIAEFSPRLLSNTKSLYQYCAIPVIAYPQLENELFCNIYYLRHLCDTQRFPDWPIKEPVKLMKDVLDEWKREVDKKPPEMSVEEALGILGLPTGQGGHDEIKIRKSYFKMAQKYHPDKNPDGRDMFEAVNKAYEFLCSKSSKVCEGPDPQRIVLILTTQSILYKRYADTMRPYKYAGYPMLIKTIELETNDDELFSKSAPLLTAASELAFHTINTSVLNAEELRREGGIATLQAAFARCVSVLSMSSKEDDMAVTVCTNISRCYKASAQFEGCREAITEVPTIITDLCRILYYNNLPRLNSIVTQTISAFAIEYWLQTQLLQAGVLWHLFLFLFKYDYTLDESGVDASDETNQQEVCNNLARLSIVAVARLGGLLTGDDATPDNKAVQQSLAAMLTPYLYQQIRKMSTREILKLLNSNTENPYLIWDNRTRAELNQFLETQQHSMIRTGECDQSFGSDFQFDILKDELVIGEIYVRVYNEQPTFVLDDPKGFAGHLLNFIGSNAQYLHSLIMVTSSDVDTTDHSHAQRLLHVEMALQSLYHVIRANAGVETECISQFKLLFSLMAIQGANNVQRLALEVISVVTGNKKCVQNIADSNVLQYLLLVQLMLPSTQELVLEVLQAITSNTQIIKEAINKGALIYLLNLFCNSTSPTVREQTAALLGKMITDKLVGPKVRILLTKFLPLIFMDAMKENPEASVTMFENTQENPELIWNDDAREKVSEIVETMTNSHFQKQKEDPECTWRLPDDFAVAYSEVEGEVEVGGVYLRLFIQQPSWVLRKPKEFLIAILDKFGQLTQSSSPNTEVLETVTTAIVCLFTAQPSLADQVPPMGHIPRIFACMKSKNDAVPMSCVQVALVLADSTVCVRTMAKCDTILPLVAAMKIRPDCIAMAAETMRKMFDLNIPELVVQALNAELVQFLLSLLSSNLESCENPSAAKAQIVKVLKGMIKDLANGDRVNTLLEESTVWNEYKEQKHDLFLTSTQTAGYLTGPVGVAGYLTAGPSTTAGTMSGLPPPLEPPDTTDTADNNDDK